MARPRFFAGQLLTQEDLQLIVDYMVGKNRLRNRFLFGEGVVCGLSVTCPPCGGGSVVVAPGYALDCCGNDIHVPCPQELDVNVLVRELRLRRLDGWDCGDPCKSRDCGDDDDDDQGAAAKVSRAETETARYGLYLTYREAQVEPVAPYLGDAACDAIACQPSRIREGFGFELRCVRKPAPTDILSRLQACIGDLAVVGAAAQKAQVQAARAHELRQAAVLVGSESALDDASVAAMADASERLAAAELSGEGGAAPDEATLRRYLADYQLLAVGVARANRSDAKSKPQRFDVVLKAARETLKAKAQPLDELAAKQIAEPVARAAASDLFELAERYASAQPARAQESSEAKLFRAGAPISSKQLVQMRLDATQLKMFLRERLEASGALTNCQLLTRLNAVRVDEDDAMDVAGIAGAARASEELALILLEYFRDCFCLALNPGCTTCEDGAVLLACLDVRDCQVIDICNMSRQFVLSPAAMRYWLPPISALGKLFELFCCELELKRRPIDSPPDPSTDEVPGEKPVLTAERSFFRTSAAPQLDLRSIDPSLQLAADRVGVKLVDLERVASLAGRVGVLGLQQSPAIHELVAVASRAGVRPTLRERTPDKPQPEIGRAVKAELEAALSDDALEKPVSGVKTVKDLVAENRTLKVELKKLSEAVKKLQG